LGEGPFAEGDFGERLRLVLKSGSDERGNVTPAFPIGLAAYQADLAATRGDWSIDET